MFQGRKPPLPASGSKTVNENDAVPFGGAVQRRAGEVFAPSQVERLGIAPPLWNAGLVRTSAAAASGAITSGTYAARPGLVQVYRLQESAFWKPSFSASPLACTAVIVACAVVARVSRDGPSVAIDDAVVARLAFFGIPFTVCFDLSTVVLNCVASVSSCCFAALPSSESGASTELRLEISVFVASTADCTSCWIAVIIPVDGDCTFALTSLADCVTWSCQSPTALQTESANFSSGEGLLPQPANTTTRTSSPRMRAMRATLVAARVARRHPAGVTWLSGATA